MGMLYRIIMIIIIIPQDDFEGCDYDDWGYIY